MLCESVDLYSYFNIPKPEKASGILKTYCIMPHQEHNQDRKRPAMLVIPGGGYVFVSKREGEPIALSYLYYGFDCFVLDYSLAPDFSYPTQLREAAMAMVYIRQNAERLHIDASKICAIGFSAGGHLCGCLGTMFGRDVLSDIGTASQIRPDAVILSYPVILSGEEAKTHMGSIQSVSANNEQIAATLSVEKNVTKDSAPAFIWHTQEDDCVPVYGSLYLAEAYKKNSVPFELHIFDKGRHGLSIATLETAYSPDDVGSINSEISEWVKMSTEFLKRIGFYMYR